MCNGNCKNCKCHKRSKKAEVLDRIGIFLDEHLCGDVCPLYTYYADDWGEAHESCEAHKSGVYDGKYSFICFMPYTIKWLYLQWLIFKY